MKKEWFFVIYSDANGLPQEWSVEQCDPRFLQDKIDHYIKFSGASKSGIAYKISRTTGKPIFSTIVARSRVPF